MLRILTVIILVVLGGFTVPAVQAAESGVELKHEHWHFDGPLGSYDRAALQRGFQVYSQVCASCHSMDHLAYRNLAALGYTEAEVKAIAAQYTVMDGPDGEGEMFERPGKPSDTFKAPFANEAAAKYVNNGALPPDLSLITKARAHGPDYIYSLLTGYEEEPPHGEELSSMQYWNNYFPGHKISMAPPLSDGIISYEDGTEETAEQYAKDVVEFLAWAAEPEMEVRKKTGIKVILFLLVFAGIMYSVKKKLWANLH